MLTALLLDPCERFPGQTNKVKSLILHGLNRLCRQGRSCIVRSGNLLRLPANRHTDRTGARWYLVGHAVANILMLYFLRLATRPAKSTGATAAPNLWDEPSALERTVGVNNNDAKITDAAPHSAKLHLYSAFCVKIPSSFRHKAASTALRPGCGIGAESKPGFHGPPSPPWTIRKFTMLSSA